MRDETWSEQNTTPDAIAAALRDLLARHHTHGETVAPARVVNLVVVCDRKRRCETVNRLENIARVHPSRVTLCVVEEGRTTLDAWVMMAFDMGHAPGAISVCRERVEIDVGPSHLAHLDNIVAPTLAPDVATVAWSPHGHPDAVDSLKRLASVLLVDSIDQTDVHAALDRADHLVQSADVVDLAWLRTAPWRERLAAVFDPPTERRLLSQISSLTVRYQPESAAVGLLLIGWLASRLGWRPGELERSNATIRGSAQAPGGEVRLRLEQAPEQSVPGLAGVTIETADETQLSLDRGPGGLTARRRDATGAQRSWTILGGSRGEAGIFGEGIRQALLRDPSYRPALELATGLGL